MIVKKNVVKCLLIFLLTLPSQKLEADMSITITELNNPGNIEAGENFAGETGEKYADRFAVFDSPQMRRDAEVDSWICRRYFGFTHYRI